LGCRLACEKGSAVLSKLWRYAVGAAWIVMLVLLPITSMPLVQTLTGSDSVAAPAGLLLPLLIAAWLVPLVLLRRALPRQALPLLAFALVAVLATLLSAFIELPAFKGIPPLNSQIKALLTLVIGLSFYLVAATWPVTEKRLTLTLRIINWTGLLIILWSLTQALSWEYYNRYPLWVRHINEVFSLGPLIRARSSGFTLEPSWLAHQLNLLYLPFWLAAAATRHSVHRFRLWRFTFEDLLLLGGAVALFLTLSRVGLLAFMVMVSVLLLRFTLQFAGWLKSRAQLHRRFPAALLPLWQRGGLGVVLLCFGLVYAAGVFGVAQALQRVDPRMKTMFEFHPEEDNSVLRYATRLTFSSRLVYWQAGWGVFDQHPFLGVGLGNAGYYFPHTLSGYAWTQYEVRELVYRGDALLNIKSFWVRLLAETGIIGFAFFISWYYLLWKTSRSLQRSPRPTGRRLAVAGQLVVIAFLIEGFSLDTFALPYLWVSLGLVTAAGNMLPEEQEEIQA
jgi:O-antigen ligase